MYLFFTYIFINTCMYVLCKGALATQLIVKKCCNTTTTAFILFTLKEPIQKIQ